MTLYILYGILWFLIFMTGAVVFSFLNVVIYRVPRKLQFVKGRSFCPSCGHTLSGMDMVPVFSYLFLRGKCRFCKGAISPRYPLIEVGGGICMVLSALRCGVATNLTTGNLLCALTVFAVLAVLTVIAVVDAETQEIPDGFQLALTACAVVSIPLFPQIGLVERLIGIVAVSVPLLLITLLIPGAFGGGDIKMMAAAGLLLGWKYVLLAFFFALLAGGAWGFRLLAAHKKTGKDHFAFGPFLSFGVALTIFAGEPILHWYFSFF